MMGFLSKGLAPVQRYVIVGMGVAILTMIAAISALSWYVLDLKEENGTLAQSVAQKAQTITDLNGEIKGLRADALRTGKLILSRDNELVKLRRETRWLHDEVEAYFQQDKEAREWARANVPSGVYQRLFNLQTEDD